MKIFDFIFLTLRSTWRPLSSKILLNLWLIISPIIWRIYAIGKQSRVKKELYEYTGFELLAPC